MGTCSAYINELLGPNSSQLSRNTRGANLTILPRKYTREKGEGHTFSIITSRCWNHLLLKLRTSQSANTLGNALYKHFKLCQHRDKIFTPFVDNLFLDRII